MRILLLTICLALAPSIAQASDAELAKAHFTVGSSDFAQGRFAAAAREFLEAYRLSRRIDLLYNIGLCYRRLDDPGRATEYYRRYLAAFPDAPDRAQLQADLAAMAPHVGLVRIRALAGTKIVVDGELIGDAPVEPLYLSSGRHRLDAEPPHHAPHTVRFRVTGGERAEINALPPLAFPGVGGEAPSTRRWLWPVVGAAATVVVAGVIVAVVLSTSAGGTDLRAQERAGCKLPGCAVVEPTP